jgi:small subunit ribosomal protein S8
MSMTDPIADFLTRIRNGILAKHSSVNCPKSLLKVRIAEILQNEGYLETISTADDDRQGTLSVTLRYKDRNSCAITGLRRVSRPGQRKYVGANDVPRVRNRSRRRPGP